MDDTAKSWVEKRDGKIEAFDVAKLTGILWRGIEPDGGEYRHARELARAIQVYLRRSKRTTVTSAAIFEMGLKTLRRVHRGPAAENLELHRTLRQTRRQHLRISHGTGQVTAWDKAWLSRLAEGMWHLSPQTARLLAGQVESRILPHEETVISREDILDELNGLVSQFGLADAVPVSRA